MFDLIDNYSFIPGSGCVDRRHSALLCPGAYCAIKTDWHCIHVLFQPIFSAIV